MERFSYYKKEDLLKKADELKISLPYSEDISPLSWPLNVNGFRIQNRIVVQPMEGYDSDNYGAPSDLTTRRYIRYAKGGSGIIWFEATAVTENGRSNPRQLFINKKNADAFARLNDEIRKSAIKEGFDPYLVIQLTHSGRYSNPEGRPAPVIASPNPLLDKKDSYVVADDDLKRLQDQFVTASKISLHAGFNAIDIKACHGYLMIELLAARNREGSLFGGPEIEKRFRYFLETIDRIKYEVSGINITVRLGISDLYPGGFGVDEKGNPDFTEPLLLVEELKKRKTEILNITMGSPYFNPHVTRPFNTPLPGMNFPDEHPLEGVARMIEGTALFQKKFPEILMTGSAYSYLRHHAPHVAAEVISRGMASFAGFGRNSFAYPSMAADIIRTGRADPSKFCIACSGCTRLIKNFRPGGCVVRDREIYGKELKRLIADGK
ncbi:MAG: hypothetical protein HPY62_09505 [Bacteroidales bacterium]|nr:hypothetical protein [Bacteroidales bacterium]